MAVLPLSTSEEDLVVPAFVQSAMSSSPNPNSAIISVTLPLQSVIGDCVIVNIFSTQSVISVTDNFVTVRNVLNPSGLGNVYALIGSLTTLNGTMSVYMASNIFSSDISRIQPGQLTVTVTQSAYSSLANIQVIEYMNVAFAKNLISFTTSTSGSISVNTSVPNELLVTCAENVGTPTLSINTTWSQRLNYAIASSIHFSTADQLADVPGVYTPPWLENPNLGAIDGLLITELLPGTCIGNVMQTAIGDTHPNVTADQGIIAPNLLRHGARAGDTIPNDLLRLYQQFYQQSESLPPSTGLSYAESLAANPQAPYKGQGS